MLIYQKADMLSTTVSHRLQSMTLSNSILSARLSRRLNSDIRISIVSPEK